MSAARGRSGEFSVKPSLPLSHRPLGLNWPSRFTSRPILSQDFPRNPKRANNQDEPRTHHGRAAVICSALAKSRGMKCEGGARRQVEDNGREQRVPAESSEKNFRRAMRAIFKKRCFKLVFEVCFFETRYSNGGSVEFGNQVRPCALRLGTSKRGR